MKYIILILASVFTFSQNKVMFPKKGNITFESKEVITDTLLYKKSSDKFIDLITNQLTQQISKKDSIEKIPDSISNQFNLIASSMKELIKTEMFSENLKEITKYKQIHKKNLIIQQIIINEKIVKEDNFDFTADLEQNDLTQITGIKEFNKEVKIIRGYKCFKVVVYYFDLDIPEGYPIDLNIMEMWVTQKIKSKYHPIIKSSEILTKYFPLEIKKSSKQIEGTYTHYLISDFTLK